MPSYLIVPCSIRPGAISPRIARLVGDALERSGEPVTFWDLRQLPLHGSTTPDQYPPSVQAWRDAIQAADVVIWVSPSYHHAIPGVAKNGLDHLDQRVMRGKTNALVGASNLHAEAGVEEVGRIVRFIGGLLPFDDLYIRNLREVWPKDAVQPPQAVVDLVNDWVTRITAR